MSNFKKWLLSIICRIFGHIPDYEYHGKPKEGEWGWIVCKRCDGNYEVNEHLRPIAPWKG